MASALFDFVMVVALQEQKNEYKPAITYRFPPSTTPDNKDKTTSAIMQFCWPELTAKNDNKVKEILKVKGSETFSFVLTDIDGTKRFGYCRRFLGSQAECYCLLSFFPSFSLFAQILDIVEQRREASSSAVFTFLKAVLAEKVPGPGDRIAIKTFSATKKDSPDEYQLRRDDNDYEYLDYVSFVSLFKRLDVNNIMYLFEALLHERRIIVLGKSLAMLSTCVHAIANMVFPFTWQHVFIPILPLSLIDYCCAPMPFLVGVLSSSKSTLDSLPLEEVVILDLDKGDFVEKPQFTSTLPPNKANELQRSLQAALRNIGSSSFDKQIANSFVLFFCDTLEKYGDYIAKGAFDEKSFMASKDQETRTFLKDFVRSQMFDCFIHEREKLSLRGSIDNCVLRKYKQNILTGFGRDANRPPQPSHSTYCDKCGIKLREADIQLDKKGTPFCASCNIPEKREKKKNLLGLVNKITKMVRKTADNKSSDDSSEGKKDKEKDKDKDRSHHNSVSEEEKHKTSAQSFFKDVKALFKPKDKKKHLSEERDVPSIAKSAEFPKKTDSNPVLVPKSGASTPTKRSSFDTDARPTGPKSAQPTVPATAPKKLPISPVNTQPKSVAPVPPPKQNAPAAGNTKETAQRRIRRTQSIGANDSRAMVQRPNLTPVKPTTDANGKLSGIPEIPATNPKITATKKMPVPPPSRPKLNRQLSSNGVPKPNQYNTFPHPKLGAPPKTNSLRNGNLPERKPPLPPQQTSK
jgi:hypothetical protein